MIIRFFKKKKKIVKFILVEFYDLREFFDKLDKVFHKLTLYNRSKVKHLYVFVFYKRVITVLIYFAVTSLPRKAQSARNNY